MNNLLSSIGLGNGITGATYDYLDGNNTNPYSIANVGATPTAPVTYTASGSTTPKSTFWTSLSGFGSGLLNFANQAAPVAAAGLNLANQASGQNGQQAKNNTASATGSLASSSWTSGPIVWIGAGLAGVVVLVLALKK